MILNKGADPNATSAKNVVAGSVAGTSAAQSDRLAGHITVTKTNQNEALLWKIAVLGMKKPPLVPEHLSLTHTGILHLHAVNFREGLNIVENRNNANAKEVRLQLILFSKDIGAF